MGLKRSNGHRAIAPLGAAIVLGLTMVGTVAAAPAHRTGHGPMVNRLLSGGAARDLSIHERAAINRGHGIVIRGR